MSGIRWGQVDHEVADLLIDLPCGRVRLVLDEGSEGRPRRGRHGRITACQ